MYWNKLKLCQRKADKISFFIRITRLKFYKCETNFSSLSMRRWENYVSSCLEIIFDFNNRIRSLILSNKQKKFLRKALLSFLWRKSLMFKMKIEDTVNLMSLLSLLLITHSFIHFTVQTLLHQVFLFSLTIVEICFILTRCFLEYQHLNLELSFHLSFVAIFAEWWVKISHKHRTFEDYDCSCPSSKYSPFLISNLELNLTSVL